MDPRIQLIGGHSQVALVEGARISILELPDLTTRSEVVLNDEDFDVAFVAEDRLAILVRGTAQCVLHIVEQSGPTKLAELVMRSQARIATVGTTHLVATAGVVTTIVDLSKEELKAYQLPIRVPLSAAGALEAHQFVIVAGGVIEEWDGVTRAPMRRIRLDRTLDCSYVGGNAKRIWMVLRDEPDHIDLVTLATKACRRLELPEPPAALVVHPSGNRLAVLGSDTQSAYVVDLSSRQIPKLVDRGPITNIAWAGIDRLVLRTQDGMLALVTVPPPEKSDDGNERSSPVLSERWRENNVTVAAVEIQPVTTARAITEDIVPPIAPDPGDRLAAWRTRLRDERTLPELAREQASAMATGGWRAAVGEWAHATLDGLVRELPALGESPLDGICARVELTGARTAVALAYGAYLLGHDGIAPLELARCLAWKWSEILGDGALFTAKVFRRHHATLVLTDEVLAVLDERS
jgi:hypothetical protein